MTTVREVARTRSRFNTHTFAIFHGSAHRLNGGPMFAQMKVRRTIPVFVVSCSTVLTLSACGGGGSMSSTPSSLKLSGTSSSTAIKSIVPGSLSKFVEQNYVGKVPALSVTFPNLDQDTLKRAFPLAGKMLSQPTPIDDTSIDSYISSSLSPASTEMCKSVSRSAA